MGRLVSPTHLGLRWWPGRSPDTVVGADKVGGLRHSSVRSARCPASRSGLGHSGAVSLNLREVSEQGLRPRQGLQGNSDPFEPLYGERPAFELQVMSRWAPHYFPGVLGLHPYAPRAGHPGGARAWLGGRLPVA